MSRRNGARSSTDDLAYGELPQRWDRDRFERFGGSSGGPRRYEEDSFKFTERDRGGRREITIAERERSRGPRGSTDERIRFVEEDRQAPFRPRRRTDRELFGDVDPKEIADMALTTYRRPSETKVELDVDIERGPRPRLARRQSSLDTFDRRPIPRYEREEYRVPVYTPVPVPVPYPRYREEEPEEDYREVEIRREIRRRGPRKHKSKSKSKRSESVSSSSSSSSSSISETVEVETKKDKRRGSRAPSTASKSVHESFHETIDETPSHKSVHESFHETVRGAPSTVARSAAPSRARSVHESIHETIREDERVGPGSVHESFHESINASIQQTEKKFKKGKTRMPKRLVRREAIMDLGYPFDEDEFFFTLRIALQKEQIDEVISISESYKNGEKKVEYRTEERIEEFGGPEREREEVIRTEWINPPSVIGRSRSASHSNYARGESPGGRTSVSRRTGRSRGVSNAREEIFEERKTVFEERAIPVAPSIPLPGPDFFEEKKTTFFEERGPSVRVPSNAHSGALVLQQREYRSDHDLQAEIRALEAERRALKLEREADDRREKALRIREHPAELKIVELERPREYVEIVGRDRSPPRNVLRIEKDRKGRMNLVRSAH